MKEIRIAVLGNVDSAKTTLISTITNNILDDGRGFARSKIFKHPHELDTGRTSSISLKHLKVNDEKSLTFIDLAGHEKYFKTTVHGLNGALADFALLVVGSNMGVLRMTREHLGIIRALKIPFFIVLTKIDICPPNVLERTYREIDRIIKKNFSRDLYEVKDETKKKSNDVLLFKLSNVTGVGLYNFRNYLCNLDTNTNWIDRINDNSVYWIDDVFIVKGIGIVISGTLKTGKIRINDNISIGPINGIFNDVIVKSIHNNFRENIDFLEAGISGCIAIKSSNKKFILNKKIIKKGMILYGNNNLKSEKPIGINNLSSNRFLSSITILHHPTTIKNKYEPVIHCGKISQTVIIEEIKKIDVDSNKESDNKYLRTGDKAKIIFRFKYRPEFIEKNDTILFREGKTKGIGKIIDILD